MHMKIFSLPLAVLLLLISFQVSATERYECKSIDDNFTGMTCLSSDNKTLTLSNLEQLGSNFDATISFPSMDTWSVKTINSIINIKISELDSFSGKIKKGKIIGEYLVKDFSKTHGELIGLGISGKAERIYANGDYFDGYLLNGKREGEGTYTFALIDGDTFQEYKECIYEDGDCVYSSYYYKDGSIHEGKNDSDTGFPHGNGKAVYASGASYVGGFVHGRRHGYGEYYYSDESTLLSYKGHWNKGSENGLGETIWRDEGYESWGGRFVKYHFGEYKSGSMTGQGSYLDSERSIIYQGGLLKGERHGQGFVVAFDGDSLFSLNGNFRNGLANGQGKIIYSDGSTYEGGFLDGDYHGLGILTDDLSSSVKHGLFTNNALNGKGKHIQYDSDGNVAFTNEINFLDGDMHGNGKVTFDDGQIFSVEYINGVYEGSLEELIQAPGSNQTKRLALVVGNDNYVNGPLNNAVSDSFGIAKQLEKSNFEVIHVTNVNFLDFESAIREFRNRLLLMGPSTTALFYYAGHAVEIDGTNYLNPIDSELTNKYDLDLNSINMKVIMSALEQNIQAVKIVILDACRNNPFNSFVRSPSIGLANMNGPSGTIISYSTSPGQVALDGEVNGYGIYTGNLINAMSLPGRSVEEVFKETRRAVQSLTNNKQTPWSSSSLTGDFYFLKE